MMDWNGIFELGGQNHKNQYQKFFKEIYYLKRGFVTHLPQSLCFGSGLQLPDKLKYLPGLCPSCHCEESPNGEVAKALDN